ncbi:uncharacterized protein LOC123518313 isoform X5 [Portunus trituberculatus]|uniref:uncharacterized protein LOC123518313 isoform X5 n=1 Tax=Portunus trituberculatus TaxID=210409 RepID=UPI001E1D0BB0|nr:uncharacterized protein LOC123518313 isoform X5 [Portunus trituberculatus]
MVQGKCKTSTNEKCFERRGRVSFRTAPVCFVILVNRRAMVDDAVRAMLQDDVIEPAASPFNAPLFLFPKSDGVWTTLDTANFNKIRCGVEQESTTQKKMSHEPKYFGRLPSMVCGAKTTGLVLELVQSSILI